jgi:hypothetical protein
VAKLYIFFLFIAFDSWKGIRFNVEKISFFPCAQEVQKSFGGQKTTF